MLRGRASTTWVEPIIPTAKTFIKPDLLIEKSETGVVMDVSIVVGSRMEETWRLKTRKYSTPENERAITTWLHHTHNSLEHMPVIISYRGESTEESRPIEKGHIRPVSSDSGWLPEKL